MVDTFRLATASKAQPFCEAATKGAGDKILKNMANPLDSNHSPTSKEAVAERAGWLKLGAVAAVSVLAGGVAAAWWYRNTLKKLRQAEEATPDSQSEISGDDLAE
jgi:hypothetical protein